MTRLTRIGGAVLLPAAAAAIGLWLSFRPMTPTGSTDSCGNAWHAVSLSTGDRTPVVPTVGQLCRPLGVQRLVSVAVIVLVGMMIGIAMIICERRGNAAAAVEVTR